MLSISKEKTNYLLTLDFILVENINQLHRKRVFLVDANYGDIKEYAVYPPTKKAHVVHNLLNLYGLHWRYIIKDRDWLNPVKEPEPKHHPFCPYAFTQKYLEHNKSLYILPENSQNPLTQQIYSVLKSIFDKDLKIYKQSKTGKY